MDRNRQAGGLAALAVAGLLCGCAATSSGPRALAGKSGRAAADSTGATAGTPASASAGTPNTAGAQASSSGPSAGAAAGSCPAAGAPASASAGSPAPALGAVQFTDPAHGWVAGAGRIMATSDGGRSWTRQYAGQAALSQVDFTDAAHGWAVGQGALLRTADGGASWTGLSEPRVDGRCLVVDSVHFVSADRGYAVASQAAGSAGSAAGPGASGTAGTSAPAGTSAAGGQLLATTDGGATWSRLTAAPAGTQTACFGSAQDGYAGASGRIWRTTDAGETWSLAFTEPGASAVGQPAASEPAGGQPAGDIPELECAGEQAAWVLFLGDGAAMMHAPYLAYATEQGTAWHGVLEEPMLESALRPKLHLPAGPGSEPGPFSAISSSAAAFVGYTPPANGYGAASVDLVSAGGATLKSAGDVPVINQPLAAAFLTEAQGWVVGENLKTSTFAVEATANGGRTWTTQYKTS